NHPGGDRRPSTQDLLIAKRLVRASRMMEIPLVDHLIISTNGFLSMAEEGWCRFNSILACHVWSRRLGRNSARLNWTIATNNCDNAIAVDSYLVSGTSRIRHELVNVALTCLVFPIICCLLFT